MNKRQRIAEAKQMVDQLYPEWERINIKYNRAISDWKFAEQANYEIGDRVCVYEASDNHGRGSDYVGSGEIIELIRYGAWYKVKLDSGEIKTFSAEFVSKIDSSKIDMRKL